MSVYGLNGDCTGGQDLQGFDDANRSRSVDLGSEALMLQITSQKHVAGN